MALPKFNLEIDLQKLSTLTARLTEHGYEESAIAKFLDHWDLSELSGASYSQYCWRCRAENSKLSQLVSFFLLGLPAARRPLQSLLGVETLELLHSAQIVQREGDIYSAQCVIYPCLGRFFFTDHWVTEGPQEKGKVYELGTDSYVLARVTPRIKVRNALDLCTGSGVHAVHSAAQSKRSTAIDINSRALEYTRLNAILNEVQCATHLGDLYTAVQGETFDLITANPPFVPSPDANVLIHRSAGESGEEVPERLVAGLAASLAPGGLFSMVLDHPIFADETYLDRLERWLGEKKGWGIAVLAFKDTPIEKYIKLHLGGVEDPEQSYRQYLESYNRLGILSVRFANVFIKRLESDSANWKIEQNLPWPNINISTEVTTWLDCLTTYFDPLWQADEDWKPTLSPNYTSVWRDWDKERGVLEMHKDSWLQPEPLNAEETELLFRIRGGKTTVTELRTQWLADDRDLESFTRAFRGLGLRRVLV